MNKITLTSDQLKRVFEVVQSAISKDVVRPVLQYAKATVKSSELTVVARLTKNGKVGAVFVSIAAAAKYYGCNYRSLFEAVKNGTPYKGHLWRHCRIDIILEE